jgi:flagellar basal body-associated protein FliL
MKASADSTPTAEQYPTDGVDISVYDDDSESSCAGTGSMSSTPHQKNDKEEAKIAAAETRAVFRLKIFVISFLVASAIGVALVVYYFTSNAEESDFEEKFQDNAGKVLEALGSSLDLTLGAVDNYVVTLVSFARFTNATWPYVTVPDYGIRAAKIRSLSKAVLISQYHFVTTEQRTTWENYTSQNSAWV